MAALPSAVQGQPVIDFGGGVFDVTGAGRLNLGNTDAVLLPFRRDLREGDTRIEFVFTIDRAGAVIDCRSEGSRRVAAVGAALCAHALANGRFEPFPKLALDYTHATYRLILRPKRAAPAGDKSPFEWETAYPFDGAAIRFGEYVVAAADQRLNRSDVTARTLDYPLSALRNDIEAQVVVALTFGEDGTVATCRPVSSSNTARVAYETCLAAQRAYRRLGPPDARPYVFKTVWKIGQ